MSRTKILWLTSEQNFCPLFSHTAFSPLLLSELDWCKASFFRIFWEQYNDKSFDKSLIFSEIICHHCCIKILSTRRFFAYVVVVTEIFKEDKENLLRILSIRNNMHDLSLELQMVDRSSPLFHCFFFLWNFFVIQKLGFYIPKIKFSLKGAQRFAWSYLVKFFFLSLIY